MMSGKFCLVFIVLIVSFAYQKYNNPSEQPMFGKLLKFTKTNIPTIDKEPTTNKVTKKMLQPLFFLSHGAPTFMYREDPFTDKDAYDTTEKIGELIKTKYKPDYIVVLSGHWQPEYTGPASLNELKLAVPSELVNTRKVSDSQRMYENSLIYDFFGFDDDMYDTKFKSYLNKETLDRVHKIFEDTPHGLNLVNEVRGLDHGAWVTSKVAKLDDYSKQGNNYIPLLQMSILPSSPKKPANSANSNVRVFSQNTALNGQEDTVETLENHYKRIGPMLRKIRQDNGLVICSGMSVHNLNHLRYAHTPQFANGFPYVDEFNQYLLDTLLIHQKRLKEQTSESDPADVGNILLERLLALGKDPMLKQLLYNAHSPTIDHFLPFVAAAGALNPSEFGKELYNAKVGSVGWGIYQFGEFRS